MCKNSNVVGTSLMQSHSFSFNGSSTNNSPLKLLRDDSVDGTLSPGSSKSADDNNHADANGASVNGGAVGAEAAAHGSRKKVLSLVGIRSS